VPASCANTRIWSAYDCRPTPIYVACMIRTYSLADVAAHRDVVDTLTDNGAIFTATPRRGGRTALQILLGELGINYINSRPYPDRPKAFPTGYQFPPHYRVRHDRLDAAGFITIRYNSRLHHIGLSKHLRGTIVTVLIDDHTSVCSTAPPEY
jgi:hypothetical protein